MILRTALTWDGEPAPTEEVAEVTLDWEGVDLRISVDAPWFGDPLPQAPSGSVPRLWEHEVVEVFVGAWNPAGIVEYLEVELGPGGHHLVLRLCGVRQAVATGLPLEFSARVEGARWVGRALVPAALLPSGSPSEWWVNATACHGPPSARRYLTAARLSASQPDFHRPHEWLPAALRTSPRAPG